MCFTVKKNVKRSAIPEAVGDLARRYEIADEPGVQQLETLVELVSFDASAPTTVTEPGAVVRDHVADSLVALQLDAVRTARSIADLGAGAGFPGLPLAAALPGARVTLVESNGRKCGFIAGAIAACGLTNAAVVQARAEEWREGRESCDLVVVRAVADLAVVAEYAAPLLRLGGTLVAWRGRRDADAEARAGRAARVLGLQVLPPVRVTPYPGAENRHLHPMVKVETTPARFPRRPGMAVKRPLG